MNTQTIEQAIPQSLDDIIRKHRDKYSLRLSTAQDFIELQPMLDSNKGIRDTLNDWRIVCIEQPTKRLLFLTGISESLGVVWATSTVVSVDFKNGLVLTNNSIYRLGSKGEGEPGLKMRMHICACFHQWGWGETLGTPRIFY